MIFTPRFARILTSKVSSKWIPGATSLLKEITDLGLARRSTIFKPNGNLGKEIFDSSTSKQSDDHTKRPTPLAAASS